MTVDPDVPNMGTVWFKFLTVRPNDAKQDAVHMMAEDMCITRISRWGR